MRYPAKDWSYLIGQRFGQRTVVGPIEFHDGVKIGVQCNCGHFIMLRPYALESGSALMCKQCFGHSKAIDRDLACRNYIFAQISNSAKERKLTFSLTPNELYHLILQPCHYCGDLGSNRMTVQGLPFVYNGLDRVDNTRGYEIDNVVPCCKHCNIGKRQMTVQEFTEWATRVARIAWQRSQHIQLGDEQ